MMAYWRRALAAQLRGARTLFALTVFGVALGIASVLAIQVINRSAIAAFEGSVAALSGDADLSVVPRAAALPESLLVAVRGDPAVRQLWPLYEITVAVDGRDRFYLTVVGVDLFAPLRLPWREDGAAVSPAAVLGTPGWAAITPALAQELGLAVGDALAVSSGTRRAVLRGLISVATEIASTLDLRILTRAMDGDAR